jgi:hypothetical protein
MQSLRAKCMHSLMNFALPSHALVLLSSFCLATLHLLHQCLSPPPLASFNSRVSVRAAGRCAGWCWWCRHCHRCHRRVPSTR